MTHPIADRLDDLEHLLAELRRWLPPAIEHAAPASITAWPGNSRPGSSTGPASVLDDQGVPMPPVPDPTGENVAAAVARQQANPVREKAIELLDQALPHLRAAVAIAHKHAPRIHDDEIHGPVHQPKPDDPGCTSCARIGQWVPVRRHAGGLCDWCYRFRLAEKGELPPVAILEKHHRGERISHRDLAMARVATRRRNKRRGTR